MKNSLFFFALVFLFGQNLLAQKEEINDLLNAYYGVKNALIAEDGKTAKTQAAELVTILGTVPVDKLESSKQKTWKEYSEKIKFDAEHISETEEAGHQRDHFNDLSNNVFSVLKALKIAEKTVYQQYCPMKKAYWLSAERNIENPYYGNKMLTCGKVTETLK